MTPVQVGWYDLVTICIIVIVVLRWSVTSEARIDEGVSKEAHGATNHNLPSRKGMIGGVRTERTAPQDGLE